MSQRDPVKPTHDEPFQDAINDLTGFEMIAIQKHFQKPFENLSAAERGMGMVWAFENRKVETSWDTVGRMTGRELAGYFPDPEDDDDLGKDPGSTSQPES